MDTDWIAGLELGLLGPRIPRGYFGADQDHARELDRRAAAGAGTPAVALSNRSAVGPRLARPGSAVKGRQGKRE
jgi:hypothetical protein